jgi:hypothetical protein
LRAFPGGIYTLFARQEVYRQRNKDSFPSEEIAANTPNLHNEGEEMRTSIRTGVALSISGLVMSGTAVLTPASAEAAATQTPTAATTTASTTAPAQERSCRYYVWPRRGTWVHRTPWGRRIGHLRHGKIVWAQCRRSSYGWVRLRDNVRPRFIGRWVYRPHLVRYGFDYDNNDYDNDNDFS